MPQRLRPALDLVSDIGKLGFDLQHHSDEDIAAAVALLRSVNDPLFAWLVETLGTTSPSLRLEDDPENQSARSCGCDPSANWICERHRASLAEKKPEHEV